MVIRKDPLFETRAVELWLLDVRHPIGIAEAVEALPRTQPGFLMDGSLVVVEKEDPANDVARVLAALANHAETADSLTARQALAWLRRNIWYEPAEMTVEEMVEATDVLIVSQISDLTVQELRDLGSHLMIRAADAGKVTILLGEQAGEVDLLIKAYGPRVKRIA
jgi:DNA-binding transcriptional ArsR family regulator